MGIDISHLKRGTEHVRNRLHHLTPDLVRYHASGGMLAALTLFDINEDALYWLRTRQELASNRSHEIYPITTGWIEPKGRTWRHPTDSNFLLIDRTKLPANGIAFRLHLSQTLFLASRF